MQYNHILFDLDGTMTQSDPGIINSVQYSLEQFGIHETDRASLRRFIGPPLTDSYRDFYGFTEEQSVEAMRQYRVYYEQKGLLECSLYPGLTQLFDALQAAGKKLYVATSKPEKYLKQLLANFAIAHYFTLASGGDMAELHNTKKEIIHNVITGAHLEEDAAAGRVVMVGDRKFDIAGALANGIPAVGVLYGYGTRSELEAAGAAHTAATMNDLQTLLLS